MDKDTSDTAKTSGGTGAPAVTVRTARPISSKVVVTLTVGCGLLLLGVLAVVVVNPPQSGVDPKGEVPADAPDNQSVEEARPSAESALTAQVERLESLIRKIEEAPSKDAEKIAELEDKLARSRAARKAGEAALKAKRMNGPLRIFSETADKISKLEGPSIDPIVGTDPELVGLLGELERVSKLKATPSWGKSHLGRIRSQCDKEMAGLVRQYEDEQKRIIRNNDNRKLEWARRNRDWTKRQRDMVTREVLKVAQHMYNAARNLEAKNDHAAAIAAYRDVVSITMKGVERYSQASMKKIQLLEKKIAAQAGKMEREKAEKARHGGKEPGKVIVAPPDEREIF